MISTDMHVSGKRLANIFLFLFGLVQMSVVLLFDLIFLSGDVDMTDSVSFTYIVSFLLVAFNTFVCFAVYLPLSNLKNLKKNDVAAVKRGHKRLLCAYLVTYVVLPIVAFVSSSILWGMAMGA